MEQTQLDLLNDDLHSRRKLLPLWIKIFIWIFLAIGGVVPIAVIAGLFGKNFPLSVYGIETNEPISLIGIFILLIFFLKAIVSYGLWFSKSWAILLSIIDATLGILICIYIMLVAPFLTGEKGFVINLRLELLALIPYLIKMVKLKKIW